MSIVRHPIATLLLAVTILAGAHDASAVCVLQMDDLGSPGEGKGAWELRHLEKASTPYQRADRPMDVLHYDLDLTVSMDSLRLAGSVVATLVPTAVIDTVSFDFLSGGDSGHEGMHVSAVALQGIPAQGWSHADDLVRVPLPQSAGPTDTLTVRIDFEGEPKPRFILGCDLRHFLDRDDPRRAPLPDEPVLQTLSEPDAARSWWPCHDHPYDAATVTLSVTGPERFELAAPGVLVEDSLLGGGLRRQTWDMRRPIPSYLVSLNMADYVSWEDSLQVEDLVDATTGEIQTRTLRVEYFAPEIEEEAARYTWARTPQMIQTFAEAFGPYPFADIKYGMSLFLFGGAMEHPTMSSMGQGTVSTTRHPLMPAPNGEWAVAHELSHQWFGDTVRLKRWGEIWLNEGLASWSECYWVEKAYGAEAARAWLDSKYRDSYPGTLVDPNGLFGVTVYDKGAWVVHQLREAVGDSVFFPALRSYMTDPALRFGPVDSEDFQRHFESAYGASLDWFFTPWLHWEGRPSVRAGTYRESGSEHLQIEQPADRVYRLPLPVRLFFDDGRTEDRVVWVGDSGPVTDVDLETTSRVLGLRVDPERDWLLDVSMDGSGGSVLLTPYPNPFNPELSIPFFVARRGPVSVGIYDLRGRLVRRLVAGVVDAGLPPALRWDGADEHGRKAASGVYFLRLDAPAGSSQVKKVTLLR